FVTTGSPREHKQFGNRSAKFVAFFPSCFFTAIKQQFYGIFPRYRSLHLTRSAEFMHRDTLVRADDNSTAHQNKTNFEAESCNVTARRLVKLKLACVYRLLMTPPFSRLFLRKSLSGTMAAGTLRAMSARVRPSLTSARAAARPATLSRKSSAPKAGSSA